MKDDLEANNDQLEEYLLIRENVSVLDDFDLKQEQLKDKQLSPVYACLKAGDPSKLYKNYELIDLAGHIGRDRTFECIAKRYFWPGMYTDIQRWVAACLKCIQHKRLKPKHHGLLVPIQSTYPFEIVSIDIIGPFKTTAQGYKYVLVMVDMFTNWVEAAPLRTLEAHETASVIFKEIITRHGCPKEILTDRGTQFTANLFEAFCKKVRYQTFKD